LNQRAQLDAVLLEHRFVALKFSRFVFRRHVRSLSHSRINAKLRIGNLFAQAMWIAA
jgi:hypothetical protein